VERPGLRRRLLKFKSCPAVKVGYGGISEGKPYHSSRNSLLHTVWDLLCSLDLLATSPSFSREGLLKVVPPFPLRAAAKGAGFYLAAPALHTPRSSPNS
jgi:hypothetical protein